MTDQQHGSGLSVVPIAELVDLAGDSAIVTGAASGIGLAVTARLAACGARVHGVDASAPAAASAAAALGELGARVVWHIADVTDEAAAARICDAAGSGLRILVNNAGVYPQVGLVDIAPASWDAVANVNVRGVLNYLLPAARHLGAVGGGSIVNVVSVAGIRPAPGFGVYGATKAAVESLTRSSALELGGRGIRVNAVAPGGITSGGYLAAASAVAGSATVDDLVAGAGAGRPLGRLGGPDAVARAVVYLATDLSDYVTGTTLVVDGGVLLG